MIVEREGGFPHGKDMLGMLVSLHRVVNVIDSGLI